MCLIWETISQVINYYSIVLNILLTPYDGVPKLYFSVLIKRDARFCAWFGRLFTLGESLPSYETF